MSKAKVEPFMQQFIVDGQWLGQSPRGWQRLYDVLHPPNSYAFACPHCAALWAHCPVTMASGGEPHRFQFIVKACRKCPTGFDRGQGIYGSLLDASFDQEFIDAFPEAVWKRELQHYLSLYPES
jgi:hypothetical protein